MKRCSLILFVFLILSSCHKTEPTPDWDELDSGHIDQQLSRKGLYGNYALVFLKNEKGYYTRQKIVDFAISKGWKLFKMGKTDTTDIPLIHRAFMTIIGIKANDYPSWLKGSNTYYVFSSSGTARNGDAETLNNDVIVSPDESTLCGYNISIEKPNRK